MIKIKITIILWKNDPTFKICPNTHMDSQYFGNGFAALSICRKKKVKKSVKKFLKVTCAEINEVKLLK